MFFSKKLTPLNSEEYEKLAKRITDVESEQDKLVAKFMSLRGLIHRKKLGDDFDMPETKKPDNINTDMLVPDNKGIGYD